MNAFKIGKIAATALAIIVGGLGLVVTLLIYANGTKNTETVMYNEGTIMTGLDIMYFALILCFVLIFGVFTIKSWVQNPKSLVRALVSIGIFAALFGIGYMFASDYLPLEGKTPEQVETLRHIPKKAIMLSSAGLNMLYILLGGSVLAVLITEAIRRFR